MDAGTLKPGFTISQIGLARYLKKSTHWVRSQGKTVSIDGYRWERLDSTRRGRCWGYKLIASPAVVYVEENKR